MKKPLWGLLKRWHLDCNTIYARPSGLFFIGRCRVEFKLFDPFLLNNTFLRTVVKSPELSTHFRSSCRKVSYKSNLRCNLLKKPWTSISKATSTIAVNTLLLTWIPFSLKKTLHILHYKVNISIPDSVWICYEIRNTDIFFLYFFANIKKGCTFRDQTIQIYLIQALVFQARVLLFTSNPSHYYRIVNFC